MIGHDHPGTKLISLPVEKLQRSGYEIGAFRPAQITFPMTTIEITIHTLRIPAEQVLLFVPGERPFGRQGMLRDGVPFLFESQEQVARKRARLTKRNKIAAAFALEVR